MIADGVSDAGLADRAEHDGHLRGAAAKRAPLGYADLRAELFTSIAALAGATTDAATRVEALAALGWTRRDARRSISWRAVIKDTVRRRAPRPCVRCC